MREFTERICELQADDDQGRGLITFVAGAVYSLERASALGYKDEPQSPEDVVLQAKQAMAELTTGEGAPRSQWLAGLYMNSTLLRLDVGFERASKMFIGMDSNEIKKIRRRVANKAKKLKLNSEMIGEWGNIRDRVNGLKHRNPEPLKRPRVSLEEVERAMNDLLELISYAIKHPV